MSIYDVRVRRGAKAPVFVDIETTGLDPLLHEIIEIAAVDIEGNVLLDAKCLPERIEDASPKALEVNGYTKEAWDSAPNLLSLKDALEALIHCTEGKIIVGSNPTFDNTFLRVYMNRLGLFPKYYFKTLDLGSMFLMFSGKLEGLGDMSEKIGGPEAKHTALSDCMAARAVYIHLRDQMQKAFALNEFLESNGEALEKVFGGRADKPSVTYDQWKNSTTSSGHTE